jgi:deoxyuridine 5'-triphosphate nucleotidohydrolase
MENKICPGCEILFTPKSKIQICCSRDCSVSIRPHKSIRDERVEVSCDFIVSEKCKKNWTISRRFLERTLLRNNNKIICLYCSRKLKFTGRLNPNTRYMNLDDNFFKHIDSEAKAYLLGWIASDGTINKSGFTIAIHEKDLSTLESLRNIIDKDLKITNKDENLKSLSVNSITISNDLCNLLGISPGKKSHTISWPVLNDGKLQWAFLRGFFDGDGCVSYVDSSHSPRCSISSSSDCFRQSIIDFCKIPCSNSNITLAWNGNNALDFLAKIYEDANYYLPRKRNNYVDWSTWMPCISLKYRERAGKSIEFKWMKTRPDAVKPSKERASDSGYDLTILEPVKSFGKTTLYSTGIKVVPEFGWYLDIVPRSSISKTGYMLANSVGIIDRTYTGEILVALIKVDDDAKDLELPCRIAQIIPRQIVNVDLIEVDSFEETSRNDGGFGSSNK